MVQQEVSNSGGDLVTPAPVKPLKGSDGDCSPECLLGSRFWELRSSEEDEDGEAEERSSAGESEKSIRYLCRTPSPVSGRDILEDMSELARRALKRIRRQNDQRLAAKAAMVLTSPEGMSSPISMSLGMSVCKIKAKAKPVLEPSVFTDDSTDGWTVVCRRCWSPVIGRRSHDPRKAVISKIRGLGPARMRASANRRVDRCGPKSAMHQVHGVPNPFRFDSDRVPNQVKVGNAVAGRTFRNLLGLAWKRIERGEPVVQWRCSETPMNGDGSQGGFNPGRGGFNAGRGGYHGRGGYGNGRGANGAQGRQNQGGGRGGQGYGGGRGFQGNNGNNGFGGGRNLVQGEASGTAGMDSGPGYQEENWDGDNGNFQRGTNFNNNNRLNYGGNQQRWNSGSIPGRGGGYQNRFRANGNGAAARTGIAADLLQQTVQAVVAAVMAAQRILEPAVGTAAHAAAGPDGLPAVPIQPAVVPVAAPPIMQQPIAVPSQWVVDAPLAGAKGKETEGPGPSKKKEEDKTACFHCNKPGHYIDDCPAPFCDVCESIHHAAPTCHLLQAPKPTGIIHGYANEALMFFELPCGAFKAKVENPKLVKVTVDGDAMTIPEIIEQLKRIVPYEKFNWEVFHFKDNVFRVKLPSKQEVQRLKNFGTHMCSDRESCLTFDFWSSLEEPLYMLPEVWVRVSGLPTDIRSDYLSLWGVGTLFGKTLDVDMAYTRKNKVLRTKIGCLDRALIPADSDVFIRRGFFKLRFEVEAVQVSQEVNMVDANNGNDGDDDANHGEGNNGGGNAMDMDPKGTDEDATSNNNEQDGSHVNNGVDGMQAQFQPIVAIQIGTMNVQLTPKGIPPSGSNLAKKDLYCMSLSHFENLSLKEKHCTNFGADLVPSRSASGSPMVGARVARSDADSGRLHTPAAAGSLSAPSVDLGSMQMPGANGSSGTQVGSRCAAATCGRPSGGATWVGSDAAGEAVSTACGASSPQKIRLVSGGGPALCASAETNHLAMMANDGQSKVADCGALVGSSVHDFSMTKVYVGKSSE
ncbi:hypothetical protein ACQ4PT_040132 [Festuca glaucescens]